jgi:hypothetical protein
MAATYQIFSPLNLKYVEISGRTNLKELSELLDKYLMDRDFHPSQRQLIDLRNLDYAVSSFWEMFSLKKTYTEAYRHNEKPIPVAIVTSSAFSKRLIWMFSRVMKDKRTMDVLSFEDMQSALQHFAVLEEDFAKCVERAKSNVVIKFRTPQRA